MFQRISDTKGDMCDLMSKILNEILDLFKYIFRANSERKGIEDNCTTFFSCPAAAKNFPNVENQSLLLVSGGFQLVQKRKSSNNYL